MKVLIADDDAVSRPALEVWLGKWGFEAVVAKDGREALQALRSENAPKIALLDWMMPEADGIEVCRRIRAEFPLSHAYLILLTVRGSSTDIVAGLAAGANDYVTKPFDREELRARLEVGVRVVELWWALRARVQELEQALACVKQLQGLLPICCYCKRIRDDRNYWQQVEAYIAEHSEAEFSHGICPDCYEKIVKPQLGALKPPAKTAP